MEKSMQVTLESQPAEQFATEALVTYVFEGAGKEPGSLIDGVLADLDKATSGAL